MLFRSGFYQVALNEKIQNEKDASEILYGKRNVNNNYEKLKSYFLTRSLNNITFFDLAKEGASEHTKAIYKCYKYLFFVHVLLVLGSRTGAIQFAKKILHLADRFELHFIAADLLDELRKHALQVGRQRDYLRYEQLLNRHIELLTIELQIRGIAGRVAIQFTKSLFVEEKIKDEVNSSLKAVTALLKKRESYFGRLSYYRLLYIHYQVQGDPTKSIAACNKAIAFMTRNLHMSPASRFGEFALYKLENFILIRDFVRGQQAASYCEKYIKPGMNLWFTYKEYQFLLAMQTLNFTTAERIYHDVISHERYSTLLPHNKEKWDIFNKVLASSQEIEKITFICLLAAACYQRNFTLHQRLLDAIETHRGSDSV